MAIRVLPPEIASRIAAGEVIERPASAVKELVENALDAGAARISVEANGGGLTLIRVVDDGRGIPADEIEIAFCRHATSKLSADADLNAVATLGFRGEALPSIAAVADVEFVSRPADTPHGAYLRLRGGETVERRAEGAPAGTTLAAFGLFRRQPARLKFLRSPSAEAGQIVAVVTHYALAYPEVRFSLVLDGRESFATSGSGDRREAAAGIYGHAVAASMLAVEDTSEGHRLEALAAPPSVSRANRSYITVFVNRRWVRSRSLTFAVEEAYRGLLPGGRFPIALVDIRVPPEEVDVNVHPAKAEVRLRNEREVFALVQRPLRRALAGLAPHAGLGAWSGRDAYAVEQAPEDENDRSPPGLTLVSLPLQARLPPRDPAPEATQSPLLARLPLLRPLGQAGTTYIIAEGPAGLYLIDQHAAHERVIFERLRAERAATASPRQGLLGAVALDLTPAQAALVAGLRDALGRHGFEVEAFGPGGRGGRGSEGYLLRGAPPQLRADDPGRAFIELLDLLTREDGPADPGDRVAASLACHAAVRAGQTLSFEEMRDLVRQLEECELPQTCPHGRPTAVHLSAEELARRFGRR